MIGRQPEVAAPVWDPQRAREGGGNGRQVRKKDSALAAGRHEVTGPRLVGTRHGVARQAGDEQRVMAGMGSTRCGMGSTRCGIGTTRPAGAAVGRSIRGHGFLTLLAPQEFHRVAQQIPHRQAAAVDPGLHGPQRHPRHDGDLRVVETLDIEEDDGRSLPFGQLGQRA